MTRQLSLQQARQALESLDREALGALGLGPGTDAPPIPMRALGVNTSQVRRRLDAAPPGS
jgi:hypothetical protein